MAMDDDCCVGSAIVWVVSGDTGIRWLTPGMDSIIAYGVISRFGYSLIMDLETIQPPFR